MTYSSLRTPLRPLSRILPARERGDNTDVIERENLRARHVAEKEAVRQRAQGRLLVLGIVFICLYSVIAIRVGTLSSSEPVEPRAQNAGASIIAQRADIVDRKGRILATNLETHSLYVETAHLIDPQQTAQELAIIFPDLKPEKLVKDFTGDRKFLWIKKKISPEQMQAVYDIGDPGLRLARAKCAYIPTANLPPMFWVGPVSGKRGSGRRIGGRGRG